MVARVAVGGEQLDQAAAIQVVCDQHQHQHKFGVQPAAAEAVAQPQPGAEQQREQADRRDEAVQLALHQFQPRDLGRLGRHRMVDEQTRQIEQPGEPADDEDDVKRFNP